MSDFSQIRVLVVDDSTFFVQLMRTMLRSFGVRSVSHASDAESALKIMHKGKVDILYVDCLMPKTAGIDLIRAIRSDPTLECRGLPIVCVTAHAVRDMVELAIRTGADSFLAKPVSARDLYMNLVQQFKRPLKRLTVGDYYGPDRRRGFEPDYKGIERRQQEMHRVEID